MCRLRTRIGFGEPQDVIRLGCQADPHLLAVDDVIVPVATGGGSQRGNIGTRAGLGEAKGGDLVAAGLRRQKMLLLFLGAPLQEPHAVQAHVDRHHHA